MHHIYTGGKGDPLCPLGFHPQVRWPTRCKRCFRDYKEHGGKGKTPEPQLKKEELTRSTPALSTWNATSRNKEEEKSSLSSSNAISSSRDSIFVNGSKLSSINSNFSSNKSLSSSASWTSTPDLESLGENVSTTVSVTLPRRRATSDLSSSIDANSKPTEFTVRRRTYTTDLSQTNSQSSSSFDIKTSKVSENSSSTPKVKVSTSTNTVESITLKKPTLKKKSTNGKPPGKLKEIEPSNGNNEEKINPDVEFILRVKSSKSDAEKKVKNVVRQSSSVLLPQKTSSSSSSSGPEDLNEEEEDDSVSVTATDTTETTLVGKNDSELLEELESLKNELEAMKARCEKVEREKSDILLRRLASFETTSTKTTASEVLKLQQKVNELSTQSEDLKDDNKSLKLRVKELEKEIEDQKRSNSSLKRADELQAKLAAAETLCEELMDENEEMKKELRELEDEIEEMQDNFREDQADEYSSLKRELEQTTKNCRILSFKLKKAERKAEQLESEKLEAEIKFKEIKEQNEGNSGDKIKKLELELKTANELSAKLSKELQESNKKLKVLENKSLGLPPKLGAGEKISRASLTRGGSQEDPQQLMRDLQDSLEREADLKEQLRFAEEEAANLRKKATRVEEDNDSLALQLKKMATKAKISRRSSPASTNRNPRPVIEKDEGISDEEDPAELKVLLELNEQESSNLRKKLEEQETDIEIYKKKVKELEEKLSSATSEKRFGKLGSLNANVSILDKEKIKVAEQEVAELKKKLVEKEREIERLENERKLSQKKSEKGHLVKSQSLDSPTEQKSLDLKRQLELVEQEASVLRTKISSLESDNEKLTAENKRLQLRSTKKSVYLADDSDEKISNLEKKLENSEKQVQELKEKLEKRESSNKSVSSSTVFGDKLSETEKLKKDLKVKADELEKQIKKNENLQETLKRLRDDATIDAIKYYKSRKPKKPTDLTTKLQLKKMVEELEIEIGNILVVLKNSQSKMPEQSKTDDEEKSQKIKELEEKLKESENKILNFEKNRSNLTDSGKENENLKKEKKKIEEMLNKLEKEKESWKLEKQNLESQIDKEKRNSALAQDELNVFKKKLETTNKQIEEEKGNVKKLSDVREKMEKLEKDILERDKKISEMEKKMLEDEEKLKKTEKNLSLSRGKVLKFEKKIEELEGTKSNNEKRFKTLEDELEEAKNENSLLNTKISDLEKEVKKGKNTIKELEESIRKERDKIADECMKAGSVEKKEITTLREDLSKKSKELDELNKKFEKLEKEKEAVEGNCRKSEADFKKEKNAWENKVSDLETDLNAERKKLERMKASHEKEQKNRELELTSLKSKIKSLEQTSGSSSQKLAEMKDEWTTQLKKLKEDLELEKKRYDELTNKYELLEEEHVVTKAQLVMEKEQAQSQLALNKKEVTALEVELKCLQDSLSNKTEAWGREKKELQEKLKVIPEKATKTLEAKWELEKAKLQAINEEQISLVEQLKQQNEAVVEQMDHMRKENEELRKKLDDFDKVSKIQRQMSADTNQLEIQLREAKGKLVAEEKNHKSEMAGLKLRYESRVNLICEELQASQNNISRFKRERDMYKHMLEEAQMQMSELKKSGNRKSNSTTDVTEEVKDNKTAIAVLEQQVSCMEDELSEARLECSKLKTELISEKSKWDVKVSELQSKINELEEEKILSSGRTKVVGLRMKMELPWQKEREDQQKLLQETSTLARDLRQTLYEVERERDKEKLESKRRQEQMKGAFEEEMEENRKKITELQYDLLELRDAHAKLRTTNEKLRREKDKWEKENRIFQRTRIRAEEGDRKIQGLLENIDLLVKATFEHKNSGKFLDTSSKKKAGSRSKESSPMLGPPDEIQLILQRLNETAEELRNLNQIEERYDDRNRRAASVGYRSLRSASTESDMGSEATSVPRRPVQLHKKNSLHRKSLSLSETTGLKAQDQKIWRDDDNDGSLTSLEDHMNSRLQNIGLRENSMDSRLSGGSTQSDILLGDKKKKKSLFGKLKKLTKSRSIEDQTSSQEDILKGGGSDSEMSTGGGDIRGSKKDLKGKLADMFKKDSSRSNSLEQLKKSENQKSKTLPHNPKGTLTTNTSVSASQGRPLDKTKNPAASLLKKP